MKVGSELQFTVPDECPDNCIYGKETFYQGCTCTRCPVFNCRIFPDPEGKPMTLVDPRGFRDDLAESWENYFKQLKTSEDK